MKPVEGSTVIGKSVTIRGEISGAEDLYLDGAIQGTVTLSGNRLTIGPNAHIVADVQVRDVIVLGQIEGNIRASGRVDLRESAVVLGDIFTSRLSIEEKASIQGRVDVGDVPDSSPGSKQSLSTEQGQRSATPILSGSKV